MIDTKTLPVERVRSASISDHSYLKAGMRVEAHSQLLEDRKDVDPRIPDDIAKQVKRGVWERLYGDIYLDLQGIKAQAASLSHDSLICEYSDLRQRIDTLLEKLQPPK